MSELKRTHLWFFKRIKINADYIICSDRTIYSIKAKLCKRVQPYPGRQRYLRIQLWSKGKRTLKSLDSLFAMHFKPQYKPVHVTTPDCPF